MTTGVTHTVRVNPDGSAEFIYDDDLQPLLELGLSDVRRVSHVEPNWDGLWVADLSPVNGPRLGPFRMRGEALAAEREWLEARLAAE